MVWMCSVDRRSFNKVFRRCLARLDYKDRSRITKNEHSDILGLRRIVELGRTRGYRNNMKGSHDFIHWHAAGRKSDTIVVWDIDDLVSGHLNQAIYKVK